MRVSTLTTMNCPRCAAPVKGDYKYCPECACRLRPEVREPDVEASSRGPMVIVVSAVLLVLAGILVGWKIVADRAGEIRVVIDPPTRTFLHTDDLHSGFESIPKGIAWYHRDDEVLTVPPGAVEKILRRIPLEDREDFLRAAAEDPARLSRWGTLISLFHERSEDVLWTRTREEPVWVLPFKCMRYEVTRGQYKEFLTAVEGDPSLLARHPWVRTLWWGQAGAPVVPDPDPERRRAQEENARYLAYRARRYRDGWWNAIVQHHRDRDAARREQLTADAFESGELVLDAPDDLAPEERDRRRRELGDAKFPPAPIPSRPAWLGPAGEEPNAENLATMNETQALLLLAPPGWVRLDAGGAIRWSIDESEDDLPVTDVCYWDAQLFLAWARKATGINRLRLPTWGEWTRAASGGNATREPDDFNPQRLEGYPWPWGHKVDPQGCNNRNHIENRKHGKRLRNVQESYSWHGGLSVEGLMSMAGNAAEWTDNIARNYRADEEGALYVAWNKDEEARTERAFVCGGSYMDGLDDCRVDSRVALFKTERRTWVGFRLVTQSGF